MNRLIELHLFNDDTRLGDILAVLSSALKDLFVYPEKSFC